MMFEKMKKALIQVAQREGLEQYEIYYQQREKISVKVLNDEISSFQFNVTGGICFRCIVNGKMGYASGELMEETAMEELVLKAIRNARCIDSEDEVFIFPGSPAYAKLPEHKASPIDDLPARMREVALQLQRMAYLEDDKVSAGTETSVSSLVVKNRLSNSAGLNLSKCASVNIAFSIPVVRDGEESCSNCEFKEGLCLEDLEDLPKKAVRGALDKLGAKSIESGTYNVVFDGQAFQNFLDSFSSVFSAWEAQHGKSLMAGKEGELVAAPCVTLTDDPMREGASFQTNFDGEGVATSRRNIIENGVLKTLLYDLMTAKKAGVESTGNGQKYGYASSISIAPYNFSINPGEFTQEELFAAAGEGIYITECVGFNSGVNSVSGDFSIRGSGFMIRNGKRAEPVKSFTVAGNFFDLLKHIERLGNEVKWEAPLGYTVFGSPDVLVRNLSVAGK